MCFRQTNIVWVVFAAGIAGLKVIEAKFYQDTKCMCMKTYELNCEISFFYYILFLLYISLPFLLLLYLPPPPSLPSSPLLSPTSASYWTQWFSYPLSIISLVLHNLPSLTLKLWPYIIVVFSFLTFVFKNGSIVVGDKSHHQASFHLPQLFYFAVFSCVMASPYFVFNPRLTFGFVKVVLTRKNWLCAFVLLLGLTNVAVHYFT